MHFNIVTPVLDGEKFLDQTILSVVSKAGPFTIRYQIQDGGSKDATLKLLAAWKSRLAVEGAAWVPVHAGSRPSPASRKDDIFIRIRLEPPLTQCSDTPACNPS